jgi:hypothetical protein
LNYGLKKYKKMHQELIKQAMGLFDTPEKWNTFLELVWQKDSIRNQWYNVLKEAANRHFTTIDVVSGWAFNSWGICDMHWYLSKFGDKSIRLHMGWGLELSLIVDGDFFDLLKVNELIKNEKYSVILSAFSRIDRTYEGNRIAIEARNYIFNSPYDSRFDWDRLAWFAGNKTELFINQIADKVNRFRKDSNITNLLNELNAETSKNA